MTAEEYFIKEFKDYSEYKKKILDGANYTSDPRMGTVMNSVPTAEAMQRDAAMLKQYNYFMGFDLGCRPDANGHVSFSDFIKHALPSNITPLSDTEARDYCLLKDIQEPYFSSLNRSTVVLQPRISYTKRLVDSNGQLLRDKNDKVITKDIDIPLGSRVVLSHISIKLPNYVTDENKRRVRHQPSQGFGYIDCIDTPDGRKYLYYLPREYIYPMNLMCLLITQSRLTSKFIWGRKYNFNRGISSAYMYVAPYANNILKPGNVVFCLKTSDNFEQEIQSLESYWQSCVGANGLPRPSILYSFDQLQMDVLSSKVESGENNLAYTTLNAPEYSDYHVVTDSLAVTEQDRVSKEVNPY